MTFQNAFEAWILAIDIVKVISCYEKVVNIQDNNMV
jgi:hypothetical protein